MAHHGNYHQWPFLAEDEFELACAHFDQRYIQAKLGPTRKIFKICPRRALTTGATYIEIIRLLQLPEDHDDLILRFEKLSGGGELVTSQMDIDMATAEEEDEVADESFDNKLQTKREQEVLRTNSTVDGAGDAPPQYSLYSHQPYVTYEIHLHPTYRMPTLWFTLHDLPLGDSPLDINSVYRYLVPEQHKSHLRAIGVTGGISADHHPVTDIPAFYIHPCQTKEAMESFNCPIEEYLMTWIGLVGGCVGLWVPQEMAQVDISYR